MRSHIKLGIMNRRLRTIHMWLGMIGGPLLLVIGMAGATLVFMDEIDAVLNPPAEPLHTSNAPLPLRQLLANVQGAYPTATLSGIRLPAADGAAVPVVTMNMQGSLWFVEIDPAAGTVLAARNADESFVRRVLALHRSFFFRPWGEAVVGLLALLFFASALTGLIIHRKSLGRIFTAFSRWRQGTKAAVFDLHTVVGTLACLFQLMMSATGFYMISPVYTKIVAGNQTAPRQALIPAVSLDSLVARSRQALPGFVPRSISLPNAPQKPVRVMGTVADACVFHGKAGSYVAFDPRTGAMKQVVNIADAPFGDQLEQIVKSVHFGQYGSLPVKIIYSLGGLTPGILSITGIIMWQRKRRVARRSSERRAGKAGSVSA